MILGWFNRLRSFGSKVTWLLTLTSGVAIMAVSIALTALDYTNVRSETLASLEAQTLIVAMNSGAPLAFADRRSAREALAAFRARPSVASAILFDVNGGEFAAYRRAVGDVPDLEAELPRGWLFPRWVRQVSPVADRGQALGRLEVVLDLADLHRHVLRNVLLSALVSLVAVALVYAISLRLNQILVRPISQLSRTARQVSETKDYTLRARKVSDDELGDFTDVFNQMLAQIQKQDLEIQASRADALHASQLKDEFLATLSHELRTPMTPILGWAQILQRSARDDPQVRQAAEVIERNARAQNRIVDDLLEMSRIISGKVRLDVQALDLANVIGAAVDTVAAAAQARGILLEQDIEPGAGLTRGDPHRLQQVLWNLLSNAIKFTGGGGRVRVRLRRKGPELEIEVADTGQGIAIEFLPHVLELSAWRSSSNWWNCMAAASACTARVWTAGRRSACACPWRRQAWAPCDRADPRPCPSRDPDGTTCTAAWWAGACWWSTTRPMPACWSSTCCAAPAPRSARSNRLPMHWRPCRTFGPMSCSATSPCRARTATSSSVACVRCRPRPVAGCRPSH